MQPSIPLTPLHPSPALDTAQGEEVPDTHHTSGAGPGRDAPLRVIYSSPPALCCLGWVKTTPAENITSGAELRRCRGEQDVEGPGEGAARAGVGRHSAVLCRDGKQSRPGQGSRCGGWRGAGPCRTLSQEPGRAVPAGCSPTAPAPATSLWMTTSTW